MARLRQPRALRLRQCARGRVVHLRAQGREGRQGVPAPGPVGARRPVVAAEPGWGEVDEGRFEVGGWVVAEGWLSVKEGEVAGADTTT